MEANKSSRGSRIFSSKPLTAQRYPFTSCSGRSSMLSAKSGKSASGDGSTTKSWDNIHSKLLSSHSPHQRKLEEQGLVTPKTKSRLENRQIQDKSYFKGLIYRKGYEISSETNNLLKLVNLMMADQSTYTSYKIKAQTQACELENLQSLFSDYNSVIDFSNMDMNECRIKKECERIKEDNRKEIAELEQLFELRKLKERLATDMESEISQEGQISDILSSTAELDISKRCLTLKKINGILQLEEKKLVQELKLLQCEKRRLEGCCDELHRKEARALLSNLYVDRSKRDAIIEEDSLVQGEEECLRKKIKEYKDLYRCILRDNRDTLTKVKQVKCDLKAENKNAREDKMSKISTLKNREAVIEDFFSSFPQKQSSLLKEHSEFQVTIANLLEKVSGLLTFEAVGTENVKGILQNDNGMSRALKQELIELFEKESLEDKLVEEVEQLKQVIERKREEISIYGDIHKLKRDKEEKLKGLSVDAKILRKQRDAHGLIVGDLKLYRDVLIEKLNQIDPFMQSSRLEKRWKDLEEVNFSIKEQLAEAKVQGDYIPVKFKVMDIANNLNKRLVE